MGIMLIISLFTARLVYNVLGIDNYGIYNLVAGIVVFFTFINSGLSTATRRYITVDIADDNIEKGKHTFNICFVAHILIALLILLLAETIGLYILNNLLNIPKERFWASIIVYQLSVFTAIISIIQSPFMTIITAYERMDIYSYFTIFDVAFKLLIVYAIQFINSDKLVLYAFLLFMSGVTNLLIYGIYTYYTFPISHLKKVKDRFLLKDIFKFMSWSILGQSVAVANQQGVSVLVNIYYNVAVNAAIGVSNSIIAIIQNVISNFQTAFNPQIIKSFTLKEYDYLNRFIIRTSKLSSFLILLFSIPLSFEISNVLALWLGDFPQYAPEFCVLTLIVTFIDSISAPLWMLAYSQSDIRKYQIILSIVASLNFFIGWIILFVGCKPYSVMIVRICICIILLIVRLYYTKIFLPTFNLWSWIKEVCGRNVIIIIPSILITGLCSHLLVLPVFIHIVCTTIVSLIVIIPSIYYWGLKVEERVYIINLLKSKIKHKC